MTRPLIDTIWRRIRQHEGEPFSTMTGVRFTYRVMGSTLSVDRTDYGIARSNFERALELVPIASPGDIHTTVRGPGYVWAVLHDKRIRQSDW